MTTTRNLTSSTSLDAALGSRDINGSQARAKRILDSIAHAPVLGNPGAASPAPTITVNATARAASGINSRAFNNPLVLASTLSPIGTVFTANGSGYIQALTMTDSGAGGGLTGGGHGCGLSFTTDGAQFEVVMFTGTSVQARQLSCKINGQYAALTPTGTDSNVHNILFDFAGVRMIRNIELYASYDATWIGINVAANDRVWSNPIAGPRVMVFGDSYTQCDYSNATTNNPRGGLPSKLSETLGAQVFPSGLGGQGVVQTAPSTTQTFVDRANGGDFAKCGAMDMVIVYNSLNDRAAATATITANWVTVLNKLLVDQPNALIYGMSGFQTSGYAVDAAHSLAFMTAFNQVKAANPTRAMYATDMSLGGQPLITISGNDTYHIYTDGIHLKPSEAVVGCGVNYVAQRITADIAAFCRSLL